jgi:uncharacterized iron-regulated protein
MFKKLILRLFVVLMGLMIMQTLVNGQITSENYQLFDAKGQPVSMEKIIEAIGQSDVVFIGENHDDPVAHYLQLEFLKAAQERFGKNGRNVALSMEMFERDVQIVLDEYLKGLIPEQHFLLSSRPWNNYKTDYRPLVEFAKENKLAVIAANAPRRYVNRVSRLGRDSLKELSPAAKRWLAPLPYATASKEYADKFNKLMSGSGMHDTSKVLDSQSLWDATMADSIARYLKKQSKALVIQLNGSFHSQERLGAPEHLLRYRSKTRLIVITILSDNAFPSFAATKHIGLGDFVIITDPKLPRTFKAGN